MDKVLRRKRAPEKRALTPKPYINELPSARFIEYTIIQVAEEVKNVTHPHNDVQFAVIIRGEF